LINKNREPTGSVNIERSLEICRTAIEKSANAVVENSSAAAIKLQQTLNSLEPLPPTLGQQQQQQQQQKLIIPGVNVI